jgi:hypothetical protein
MNILEALFTKPRIHSVPRFHAATKRESAALRRKREETTEALRRYVTEQRLLAAVREAVK